MEQGISTATQIAGFDVMQRDAAGLAPVSDRNRADFAVEGFDRVMATIAADGPPPPRFLVLMGGTTPLKIENYPDDLHGGGITPTETIFCKT